jgi:hypothetical protein
MTDERTPVADADATIVGADTDSTDAEVAWTDAEPASDESVGSVEAPDTPGTSEASEPSGPRTVGRLIADALRSAGVRYAFTVPGESFLGLLDALGDAGIRVVATRHEGGAAFMAEAHGNLTGRPAACIGTRAVGASNLAIGIHTARQDSSPMFALVGQVERALGHEAFRRSTGSGRSVWQVGGTSRPTQPTWPASSARPCGGPPLVAGPVYLSLPEDLLIGSSLSMPRWWLSDPRRHGPPTPTSAP